MYDGYNKIFWGIFVISFNINFGVIKILPGFIGFLIILSGINTIYEESNLDRFETAKTLGIFMTIIAFIGESISFFTHDQIGYSLVDTIWTIFYISFELVFFFKLLEASIEYLEIIDHHDMQIEYTYKLRKYTIFFLLNIFVLSIALIFNLSMYNGIAGVIAIILRIYLMVIINGLKNNWDRGSDPCPNK